MKLLRIVRAPDTMMLSGEFWLTWEVITDVGSAKFHHNHGDFVCAETGQAVPSLHEVVKLCFEEIAWKARI